MSKISELSDGGSLQSTDYLIAVRSGGNVKVQLSELPSGIGAGGNIVFGDNEKAIFGAGSDLQIYHNGSNSYIEDAGTGSLIFRASTATLFQGKTAGENQLTLAENGAVTAYYDNAAKLATTATGIDVTGTVTADGLTVSKAAGDIATLEGTGTTADVEANLVFNPVYDVNARIVSARDGAGLASRIAFETGVDNTGSTIQRLNIASNGDISFYEDTGTTPKFFWDASEEKLSLGSTSFAGYGPLQLGSTSATSADSTLQFLASSASASYIQFGDTTSATDGRFSGFIGYLHSSDAMRFATSAAEAMRITSSGDLLVGATSATISNEMVYMLNDGRTGISAAGDIPLIVNRKTDAGGIIEVRKDQGVIGNIGVDGGGVLQVVSDSTSLHLRPNNGANSTSNYIYTQGNPNPWSDNYYDLGSPSYRYKSLYLSGGAYLGGTGAANLLDHYEEGVFTPTLGGSTTNPTVTYAAQSGVYTKIGNLVTATVVIGTSANTGGAGSIQIKGLPFTSKNASEYRARDMINTFNLDVDTNCVGVGVEGVQNGNYLLMLESRDNQSWRQVDWSQATSASIYFAFTFQYYV